MPRLGLIQISDTQFGPKHVFREPHDLSRRLVDDTLAAAGKYAFLPSYLICSGDLAETGTAEQFNDAQTQIKKIANGLSIDNNNVLFVPGNHDINRDLAMLAEKIGDPRLKLQCYDNFCATFYGDQRNLDRDAFQTVIDYRIGICIVLLNSCEKEDHEVHIGNVCSEKLLKTMNSQAVRFAKSQRFFNIAVLHHRVDTDGGEERSKVDNADEIAAILAKNGFQLTLTGHIHSEVTNATSSDGITMIYSGCGSTGVDQSQRPEGVPNQYSVHVLDNTSPAPKLESYFRSYNPRRRTQFGLGGWTRDTTYDQESQVYDIQWTPLRQFPQNAMVEDASLNRVLGVRKNPFTVSNAEKFSDDSVLRLFVQDEERHRSALRLTGDAIIRGPRGSGKTMCLKYLNALGTFGFKKSVDDRQTAECLPVLVNLGQLHVADRDTIDSVYAAAETLLVEQTLNSLDSACDLAMSQEFSAAVHRARQRYGMLSKQSGSLISHLGAAIKEHLSRHFDHVLLLIDEIAPVFPRVFFTEPEAGFGKWMNSIRNSGPYNTRITVYPNDVSDTLNEDRFGSIVNLNFDPTVLEELVGFRKYATNLFNVYMKEVATTGDGAPTIDRVMACSEMGDDPLEQLLYAANGSSRRLMRLFEKSLALRCREGRDDIPLSKDEIFELITEYSVTLVSSYTHTEQQLAASIAKACKRASTFRFRLPHLSDAMKRLCLSREETNITSIVELGTGTRATAYEFNFPYCVQHGIPTHHIKESARINHGREIKTGEWIHKTTSLTKESLEVFQDEGRMSGRVEEVDGAEVIIAEDNGGVYIAYNVQVEFQGGEAVSFIAIGETAEDLLLIE